jgi:hypothetical protein
MVSLYVFSLILGGGFLAMSVFGDLFGGHGDVDLDGDLGGFDGHLELDAGGIDLDTGGLDLDAGGLDLDAGGLDLDAGHLDVNAAHAELDADAGSLAGKIFSIRTLFYSLFGFGSVGTLLTFVWSGNPLLTAAFAVFSGISSGAVINAAFGYVKRSESGMLQTEASYSGLSGRVTLPIRSGIAGRIVVERGGKRVELRALPHSSGRGDPSTWTSVLVVEMEKGVAQVAPIDEEMLLGS